ncbi:hypothetical protein [Micromonospora endophytica]|uniref:Uncharacterized protein n=1 Tax=Micromonospora endophytica TaxID=515350 RepID=A0A2W2C9K5_9ACTN|nr:hypothetical protein [Micromonospora endophytica]PZF96011.1 hypothetical protein C1I93_14555 [Micromonospora endophytica]RIW46657.1 hypothetical protein D3H59_12055 [Micromonospora endophytica]BCJ59798.1 hypothetical protein Jiend_32200 [Micromonospora endophytica]
MSDIETIIREAYADQVLRVPETALPGMVRRRRRRQVGAALAVALLVAVGGVTFAMRPFQGANLVAAVPESGASRAYCDRVGAEQLRDDERVAAPDRTLPSTVVSFGERGQWAHLYLGERVIVSCVGPHHGLAGEPDSAETGVLVEIGTSPYDDPAEQWFKPQDMTSWGQSFAGGQSYRLVAVPAGTLRAELVLADGTIVPATLAAGLAVGWLPTADDQGLLADGVAVRAYTRDTLHVLSDGEVKSSPR